MNPDAMPSRSSRTTLARTTWIAAALTSVSVLLVLASQIEPDSFAAMLANLRPGWVGTALLLFAGEAIATTWRIQAFARTSPSFGTALTANAWYVAFVLALPLRLGELAAVALFQRLLRQSRGGALSSIVTQRLFDAAVVCALALGALLFGTGIVATPLALAASGTTLIAAIVAVAYVEDLLASCAGVMHGAVRPAPRTLRRFLLRTALQGRAWSARFTRREMLGAGLVVTLLKWSLTLAATATLILAVAPSTGFASAITASAVYILIASLPVATIGGIGPGELGLAGMLVALGTDPASAAGIAIVVRTILIVFSVLFCAAVIVGRPGRGRTRASKE